MSEYLFPEDRADAVRAIAGIVGDVALNRVQPSEDLLGSIVDAVARRLTPLLPPVPEAVPSLLIEFTPAEAMRMAEVVQQRIAHPSHNPVQAVRAGLAAVNDMRASKPAPRPSTRRPAPSRSELAAPVVKARKVWRLGVAQRGTEWIDVDGDRWRWCWAACAWQYQALDSEDWVVGPNGAGYSPSGRYAPFTEVSK
ncbi:hypothetical protein I5H08_gp030 [Mycobacterium phage Yuna]|uniref:DUF7183 domain-containing protein n=1 Tax=Mycobacterium phage Yuna TaxID=2599885 RepID=A0A5J6THR5_9CAUD|nr:hypothetical protein I5H08_gp030 [Mycobacterium phage Yuna]QFG09457.1 hypothetical protein PBI_YUNA_75 [Mycobacterium phage Yuna]